VVRFLILWLILFGGAAIYAGLDMHRRGQNGWPYALGLDFLGLLGVVAWVIGRARYPVIRQRT
jgi:hypothetical protein